MATLPEIAEWVAGVYQIEEADPVLGGPPNEATGAGLTNIPALHLAKRTAFLKQVLDDAGIGATAAPSIADFNLVDKSGLYQADGATNAPEPGVPFTLLHINSSATQATQFASRITSDRVWFRRLAAGTWSTWREMVHTGNVASFMLPAGSVVWHAADAPPAGFLKANGAAVSRTTYADLFAAIGTTFGAGDGSTTFALPDLRGEFIRGWSDGRSVDAGRAFGSFQGDDFKSHQHVVSGQYSSIVDNTGGSSFQTLDTGTTQNLLTAPQGGSETRPRNVALLACIKY